MHLSTSIIFLSLMSANTYAADYDIRNPGSNDMEYIECDNYVRDNHKEFITDMNQLIEANNNQNWALLNQLTKKYDNELGFIANPFTHAVYDCGFGYTFSDGIDHYRNLYGNIALILMDIQVARDNKKQCSTNTTELLDDVIKTIATIVNSTNKAANKSLNRTGAKNAPPG